jgi:hypothetical protein
MARLDDGVLEAMVGHVLYEVDLLYFWTGPGLRTDVRATSQDTRTRVINAIAECALIHLRNVSDFLIGDLPCQYPKDFVAADYFDEPWPGRPGFVLGRSEGEHRKTQRELNRRLAHISTHRLRDFKWEPLITKYAPMAVDGFRAFLADLRLAHPDRAQWFFGRMEPVDESSASPQ